MLLYTSITCVRRLIPVRKDIEVVGCKMTKHSDECGQHLQAQNMVNMSIHVHVHIPYTLQMYVQCLQYVHVNVFYPADLPW